MKTAHRQIRRFLGAALIAGATVSATLLASGASAHAEGLNCVQFVQKTSTVALRGDGWQWWEAANGRYARGHAPRPGAVMVFAKSRILPHGHVGVVRRQPNSRTVLIDHANWSPIGGRRGQVERAAMVVDVSPGNDWSQVRVWYQPTGDIGQTVYHISGFVYAAPIRHHYR